MSLRGGGNSFYSLDYEQNLSNGLDFILSHFQEPLFPRTISTFKTCNKQLEVFSKENALNLYQYSQGVDCKINAYPSYTEWNGLNRQAPSFVFIDLDRGTFDNEKSHLRALKGTLRKFKEKLGTAEPTVLWSGNGYHVYQPIDAVILEEYEIFSKFDHPSRTFLKYAEQYFSYGKSDPAHTPTYKSCMIRVPGSHNSKCISKNDDIAGSSSEIKIIQKWNGFRPKINLILSEYHAHLVQQRLMKIKRQKQLVERSQKYTDSLPEGQSEPHRIPWIEKLLGTPLQDYRKNAIGLILAPYFINITKFPYEQAFVAIKGWTDKCSAML